LRRAATRTDDADGAKLRAELQQAQSTAQTLSHVAIQHLAGTRRVKKALRDGTAQVRFHRLQGEAHVTIDAPGRAAGTPSETGVRYSVPVAALDPSRRLSAAPAEGNAFDAWADSVADTVQNELLLDQLEWSERTAQVDVQQALIAKQALRKFEQADDA